MTPNPIQTNNLAVTPQPMTAALIFRRQLVRHKADLLTASSTADKLPLEKFHRLLDLVFWGKFLKFDSVSCFVFLWDVYRVSPGITGYHSTRWFLTLRACGAPLTRPGGRATLSCPPGPRLAIAKFWHCIHCLHCYL